MLSFGGGLQPTSPRGLQSSSSTSTDPILSLLPTSPSTTTATVFDILILNRFSAILKDGFDYAFRHVFIPQFPMLRGLERYKEEIWLLLALRLQGSSLQRRRLPMAGPSAPSLTPSSSPSETSVMFSSQDQHQQTSPLPPISTSSLSSSSSHDPFNHHHRLPPPTARVMLPTTSPRGGGSLEETFYGWIRREVQPLSTPTVEHVPHKESIATTTISSSSSSSRNGALRTTTTTNQPTRTSFIMSLVTLAIVPYLRTKLLAWSQARTVAARQRVATLTPSSTNEREEDTDIHHHLTQPQSQPALSQTRSSAHQLLSLLNTFTNRSLDLLAAAYPSIHAGYDLLQVGYLVAYGTGLSRYGTPSLHAAKCELVKKSEVSSISIASASAVRDTGRSTTSSPPHTSGGGAATASTSSQQAKAGSALSTFSRTVEYTILTSLLLLKVLQWWHERRIANESPDSSMHAARTWQVVPPPPPPPPGPAGPFLSTTTDGCTACGATPPITPVAAPSGQVYCEGCVLSALQHNLGGNEGQQISLPPQFRKLFEE